MSSAKKYLPHYTQKDYRRWEGDWQLIKGVAVSMSPSPAGPHERAVLRLAASLLAQLEDQKSECCPYAGLDWIINDDTTVRPDVMIVCGDQPEMHLEKPPVLVAEVLSPNTWRLDTESKKEIYQDSGVSVYLIVDTDLKSIEIIDFKNDSSVTVQGETAAPVQLDANLSIELVPDKIFR